MIDITKYVAGKKIEKDILKYVYVHEIDGYKYAVATDSFRLARVQILGVIGENIDNGFYTPEAWKKITKIYNKDDISLYREMLNIIQKEMAVQPEEDYPEYQRITPEDKDLEDFTFEKTYNGNYICELIKAVQSKDFNQFDFKRLKHYKDQLVYKDYETLILIMPMRD